MSTPEQVRVAVLLLVILVASIDLGLAAVMRAGNEAGREHDQ